MRCAALCDAARNHPATRERPVGASALSMMQNMWRAPSWHVGAAHALWRAEVAMSFYLKLFQPLIARLTN